MATTGVLGWIARIAAIVLGAAFLIVTCVVSIPVFLLAYPVHVTFRRRRRPLRWVGSWITTVVVTSVLFAAVIGLGLLHRDKTGETAWHSIATTASQAQSQTTPPPPPQFLKYFPGAAAAYHPQPLSPGASSVATAFGLWMMAEIMGVMLGSLIWAGSWLVVSGWTGRLAGVQMMVDDPRAQA